MRTDAEVRGKPVGPSVYTYDLRAAAMEYSWKLVRCARYAQRGAETSWFSTRFRSVVSLAPATCRRLSSRARRARGFVEPPG